MPREIHYRNPDRAAKMLREWLESRVPGVQAVGVAGDGEIATLIVYLLNKKKIAAIPKFFDGYPVRVERIGRIRPVLAG